MEHMDPEESLELLELKDPLDLLVALDLKDPLAPMGELDQWDLKDLMDQKDLQDLQVQGPSTPDRGKVLVQTQRALSYSTLATLEGHILLNQVVEQITYACLRTQSTAWTSHTKLGHRNGPTFMALNMKILYKAQMMPMCLVLCAMCPLGLQWP